MDIDVEVSQTVSPNDTEEASTSTSNNNVVNTNVGNNPASNNKKHSQPSASQGQLPSHKPPPIVVDHCENLNGLIRSTDKIVDPSKYSLKCHPNNSVSILAADPDAYRAITKSLTLKKVSFHSWQLKEERSYRVVIRGVHHSIPDENIKESLTLTGHKVRFVNRPRSRFDKTKFVNLVFVELETAANNKDIHEIKTLCRQRVQVELPYKKDEVVQCHRCQAFGHTKNHSQKLSNCVRCGLQHGLEACVKDVHPVKCVNCGGNHTASYKGCVVYQKVAYRRKGNTSHRSTVPQQSTNSYVRSNFVAQNSPATAQAFAEFFPVNVAQP